MHRFVPVDTKRSDAIATFCSSWARDGHFACQCRMTELRLGFEGLGNRGSTRKDPVETLGTYGHSTEIMG